jgi:hypothetical protein
MVMVTFLLRHDKGITDPNTRVNRVAEVHAPADAPTVAPPEVTDTKAAPHRSGVLTAHAAVARAVPPTQVAVLVPRDGKAAVDTFLASLRTGAVDGETLIAGTGEQPPKDVQLSPVVIAPIEVAPLKKMGEESAPEPEKSGR